MRRFLIIIFTLLYVATTAGVTLRVHYCMGEFESWGIGYNHSEKCGKCGMDEAGNACCKDEVKFLKNASNQKVTELVFKFIPLGLGSLVSSFVERPFAISCVLAKGQVINVPHRGCSTAVYIRNHIFRI